jgi:iron complex outermembrane receptor protein
MTFLGWACAAEPVRPDSEAAEKSGDLPAENELLPFQDLPVVISASRQVEKQGHTSVPVSVVTADDIHYGGAMLLPDVLSFVPGVDVLQLDRNRMAIGVRGLHEFFSHRTLVLIDGRSAENPIYGGSEFLRYPVFMEDISRVEVVRGAAGAAWGANAFNGVINIITKKPEDAQGVLATSTVDEYGDTSSEVRWGAKKDKWSWRTSFGFRNTEASDDAIHEDKIDDGHYESRDFHWEGMFDGQAAYQLSPETRVSFGAGYQYMEMGDFEWLNVFPREDGQSQTTRAFSRVDHTFNGDMSGYLQWFGNFSDYYNPTIQDNYSSQNDLEGQVNLVVGGSHHLSMGANGRWTREGQSYAHPYDLVHVGEPYDEYQGGAFVLDRWEVNRRLSVEGQARGDLSSIGGANWSARLTVLFGLDESNRHMLRLSGARAFRESPRGFTDLTCERGPKLMGISLVNLITPPGRELDDEGVVSGELGYTGQLLKNLTFSLDGYYQRYEDLVGVNTIYTTRPLPPPFPPFPLPIINLQPDNIGGAHAFGGEAELAYTWKWGRVSAWYAYNGIDTDEREQNMMAFLPAANKVGLTARLFLPHQVVTNLQYRYNDFTDVARSRLTGQTYAVGSYHRLDFTVSKKISGERFELMLGVRDVLNETQFTSRQVGSMSGHDVPGRAFFGRFQMKF